MRRHKQTRPKQKYFLFTSFGLLLLFLSILFWRVYSLEKFIYISKTDNGGGEIVSIDPTLNKVNRYLIPPETVLVSSRGYGEYKISSLWILGEKENLNGQLVSETVTKNYFLPVYFWKNEKSSNMSFAQLIKILFLSRNNHDNAVVFKSFDLPKSILVDFINDDIQEEKILIDIDDMTNNNSVIESVSLILGNMGTKVSTLTKGYDEDFDCEVSGKNVKIITVIAKVFGCEPKVIKGLSVDIKIKLGNKFAERF